MLRHWKGAIAKKIKWFEGNKAPLWRILATSTHRFVYHVRRDPRLKRNSSRESPGDILGLVCIIRTNREAVLERVGGVYTCRQQQANLTTQQWQRHLKTFFKSKIFHFSGPLLCRGILRLCCDWIKWRVFDPISSRPHKLKSQWFWLKCLKWQS